MRHERPSEGARAERQIEVDRDLTAPRFVPGTPEAYATPAMVALIELAAHEVVADALAPDETTVGTFVEAHHLAPTPAGLRVRCEAVLKQVDGRKLRFEGVVHDDVEKIAEFVHDRYVVRRDRFHERLAAKAPGREAEDR